jgi:acyl carrier protein
MSTYSPETLELVRDAVARIKEADLAGVGAGDGLNLDSVDRIGLIAELENVFGLELPSEAIAPEVFESLATLAVMVDASRR